MDSARRSTGRESILPGSGDIHLIRYHSWKTAFEESITNALGSRESQSEAVKGKEGSLQLKAHPVLTEPHFLSNTSELFQQRLTLQQPLHNFSPPESSDKSVQDQVHSLGYRPRRKFKSNSSSSSGVSSQNSSNIITSPVKFSTSHREVIEEMMQAASLRPKLLPTLDTWKEDAALESEATSLLEVITETFKEKYSCQINEKLLKLFHTFAHIELLNARGVNLIRREKCRITLGFLEGVFQKTEADFGHHWLSKSFSEICDSYNNYDDPCELAVIQTFGKTYGSLYARKKEERASSMNETLEKLRQFQVKIDQAIDRLVCCEEALLELYLKEVEEEATEDSCKYIPALKEKFRDIFEETKNLLRAKNMARIENETKFARRAVQYATAKYCEIMEMKMSQKIPCKPEELKASHMKNASVILNSSYNVSEFLYTGPWLVQQAELQKSLDEEYAEILRSNQAKLKLWKVALEIGTEDFVATFRRKIMQFQSTALEETELQTKRKDLVQIEVSKFRKQYPGAGPARVKELSLRFDQCFDALTTPESLVSFLKQDTHDDSADLHVADADASSKSKPDVPQSNVSSKPDALLDASAEPNAPADAAFKPVTLLIESPAKPKYRTDALKRENIPLSTVSLLETSLAPPLLLEQTRKAAAKPKNETNQKIVGAKRLITPSEKEMLKPVHQNQADGLGIFFTASQVRVSLKLKCTDSAKTFFLPLNICLEQTGADESPVLVEEKNHHRKPGHSCINFYSMTMDPQCVHTQEKFTYKNKKEKLWAEEILAMFFKRLAKIISQRFDADVSSTVVAIAFPASTPGVCKQRIKTALQLGGFKSGGIFLQAPTAVGLSWVEAQTTGVQPFGVALYIQETSIDFALFQLRNGNVNIISLRPGITMPRLSSIVEGASEKLKATLESIARDTELHLNAIEFCNCVVDLPDFHPERLSCSALHRNLKKLIIAMFVQQKKAPSINITNVRYGILPGLTKASSSSNSRLPPCFRETFAFTIEVFGLAGSVNKKKLVSVDEIARDCIYSIPFKDIAQNGDQVTRVISHRNSSDSSTTEMRLSTCQKDTSRVSPVQVQIRVNKEGVVSHKTEDLIRVKDSLGNGNTTELPLVKVFSNCMSKEDYELTRKRLNRIWAASSKRRGDCASSPHAKRRKIETPSATK